MIETDYLGLPPSGSLLVWIDSFLDEPRTPHEQTAGRFGNALIVRSLLSAEVLDRVTVKAFSVGEDTPESVPTRHGNFGRRRFWEESLWLPRRTVSGYDRR